MDELSKLKMPGAARDGFLLVIFLHMAVAYAVGVLVGWMMWAG